MAETQVVRGKVYDKETRRYLGTVEELEAAKAGDLGESNVKELRDKAKSVGVTGYSNMTKDELVEAIVAAENADEDEDDSSESE